MRFELAGSSDDAALRRFGLTAVPNFATHDR